MKNIETYSSYVFVFAHPDDEVYCAGLLYRLNKIGKQVDILFITSGDSGVHAQQRELEVSESMQALGIPQEKVHLLRFSEKEVLDKFFQIFERLRDAIKKVDPEVVVGMDYEGGHEVHDSVSFLTSEAVKSLQIKHFVYPLYHARMGKRFAGDFIEGRQASDNLDLTPEEIDVKIGVLEAHRGQIGHFLYLQKYNPEYFKWIFKREVFRGIDKQINYRERPALEIGYESHRNGFKYPDFKKAVNDFLQLSISRK